MRAQQGIKEAKHFKMAKHSKHTQKEALLRPDSQKSLPNPKPHLFWRVL
ncbi:MAG: hypothetical protein LBF22_01715 [Deltaproteobacteria bacterium]|nr:hypothetical protein [Deltaproteobacteria bacterium]